MNIKILQKYFVIVVCLTAHVWKSIHDVEGALSRQVLLFSIRLKESLLAAAFHLILKDIIT